MVSFDESQVWRRVASVMERLETTGILRVLPCWLCLRFNIDLAAEPNAERLYYNMVRSLTIDL